MRIEELMPSLPRLNAGTSLKEKLDAETARIQSEQNIFISSEENSTGQNPTQRHFPSAGKMALNFVSAIKSEAESRIAGAQNVGEDEIKQRLEICSDCEFYHKLSKRCKKCWCFLKWKTAWRSQKCPIGKW